MQIFSLITSIVLVFGIVGCGLVVYTGLVARRVEADLPPLGRFIEIGATRMHYVDEGSGPPIVFIHGLAGQMRHFTHSLVDKLKGEFRIILLDRPGSGYTNRPAGQSARLSTQADTIAALMATLGLEKPLIVGHSLGGAIALQLALNHPERVGGLALMAPLTHSQTTPPDLFRGLAILSPFQRWLTAWTIATPLSIRNGPKTLETLFGPDRVPADFSTKAGGSLVLRPSNFISASSDLVAVNDDLPGMIERYASLTLPIGVLFGTSDLILDGKAHGLALAEKIPALDLEWVEGGGHMTPMSSPDRAAGFVTRTAHRIARASSPPAMVRAS